MKLVVSVILIFSVNQIYAQWSDNPYNPREINLPTENLLYQETTNKYFSWNNKKISKFDANGTALWSINTTNQDFEKIVLTSQGDLIGLAVHSVILYGYSNRFYLDAYKIDGNTGNFLWGGANNPVFIDSLTLSGIGSGTVTARLIELEADTQGGVFLKYIDRANQNMLQHLNASGNKWSSNHLIGGRTAESLSSRFPLIASDKNGGCYVVYFAINEGRCKRVLADGTSAWDKSFSGFFSSVDFRIEADNNAVFIALTYLDIYSIGQNYLQRVDINGNAWSSLKLISNTHYYSGSNSYIRLKADGKGNCFVLSSFNAQLFSSSGAKLWGEAGVSAIQDSQIARLPSHIWIDNIGNFCMLGNMNELYNRSYVGNYLQKINSSGTVLLGHSGKYVGRMIVNGLAPHTSGYLLIGSRQYVVFKWPDTGGEPVNVGMVINENGTAVGSSSAKKTAQSGNWATPSTWVGGQIPSVNDTVLIRTGHNVTLNQTASVKQLQVYGGLNINGQTLNIGKPGGDYAPWIVSGEVNITSNSLVNLNGFLCSTIGSTFSMSGGKIVVDGIDNTLGYYVNIDLIQLKFVSNLALTGGTILIKESEEGYENRNTLNVFKPVGNNFKIQFGNDIKKTQWIFCNDLGKLEMLNSTNAFSVAISSITGGYNDYAIVKDSIINLNPNGNIVVVGSANGHILNQGGMSTRALGTQANPVNIPQFITGNGIFNIRYSPGDNKSGIYNTSTEGVSMQQRKLSQIYNEIYFRKGKLKLVDTEFEYDDYRGDGMGSADAYFYLTGTSKLSYIFSDGASQSSTFIPIGTKNGYAPLNLSCANSYGLFDIKMADNTQNQPAGSRVGIDWEIGRLEGNCNPALDLHWSVNHELGGFNRNQVYLASQTTNSWTNVIGPIAASNNTSLYSIKHQFQDFGKFRIYSITPPCPQSLSLTSPTNDISTGIVSKQANSVNGIINAINKITGSANVSYESRSILLNSGFRADAGTVFKAQSGGCQ